MWSAETEMLLDEIRSSEPGDVTVITPQQEETIMRDLSAFTVYPTTQPMPRGELLIFGRRVVVSRIFPTNSAER
jgi:hypothetical protein